MKGSFDFLCQCSVLSALLKKVVVEGKELI